MARSSAARAQRVRAPQADTQLSLIPDAAHSLRVQYVPRESVHPDPAQPRAHPDAELAALVAVEGILQPITVCRTPCSWATG